MAQRVDAISLAIDYYHFHDNLPLSIMALIFSFIWCLYFFLSYRVEYVLSRWTGIWNYDSFKGKKTAETDAQLQRAGLVKATASFSQKEKCRKKATIYIVISVIVLIFGTILVSKLGQDFKGLQTIVAIIIMAWGMGYYAVSKGYSRSLGLLLGILSWFGLIILFFLEDKNKQIAS